MSLGPSFVRLAEARSLAPGLEARSRGFDGVGGFLDRIGFGGGRFGKRDVAFEEHSLDIPNLLANMLVNVGRSQDVDVGELTSRELDIRTPLTNTASVGIVDFGDIFSNFFGRDILNKASSRRVLRETRGAVGNLD